MQNYNNGFLDVQFLTPNYNCDCEHLFLSTNSKCSYFLRIFIICIKYILSTLIKYLSTK